MPQFRHKHPAETSAAVTPVHVSHRMARVRAVTVAAVVALVVAAASAELYRRAGSSVSATSLPRSIAVLPFKNLTGDTAQEYLSDALTESLITEVSKLGELSVVSRGSAFTFKGKAVDPRESGRALGVAAVLEGSVRKNGDAVRVDVRLVSASNGEVLWVGDTVDRLSADLFIIEDQIACDVTAALTGKPCIRSTDVARGTHDLEAYRSYLRGRFHVQSHVLRGRTRARVADRGGPLQPGDRARPTICFRLCRPCRRIHAARVVLAGRRAAPPRVGPRPLRSGPSSSTIGWLKRTRHSPPCTCTNGNLPRPAARLNGRSSCAIFGMDTTRVPTYLMTMGQTDAGLAEMRKAEELDPLNATILADRGNTLVAAHRYEEALAQYRRACDLELTCAPSVAVGAVYLLMGKYSEGIAELQKGANERGGGRRHDDMACYWLCQGGTHTRRRAVACGGYAAVRQAAHSAHVLFVHPHCSWSARRRIRGARASLS